MLRRSATAGGLHVKSNSSSALPSSSASPRGSLSLKIQSAVAADNGSPLRPPRSEVDGTFNSIAQSWLQQAPKPPDLADWAGEGWKGILIDRLEADLKALNTPRSGNVKALSKRYLDGDITMSWSWKGTSAAIAASRLDKLIRLRGEFAHRGPDLFKGASARPEHVEDALRLLTRLVECTERAAGTAPRTV